MSFDTFPDTDREVQEYRRMASRSNLERERDNLREDVGAILEVEAKYLHLVGPFDEHHWSPDGPERSLAERIERIILAALTSPEAGREESGGG